MNIRPLTIQDAAALQTLRTQMGQSPTRGNLEELEKALKIETIESQLQHPSETFGAYEADALCGASTLSPMPEDPLEPENPNWYALSGVIVCPKIQGKGIGRSLVETCISRAIALGANGLFLEVNTPDSRAMQLYQSLGFKIRHRAEAQYTHDGTEFDQVSMYLKLASDA